MLVPLPVPEPAWDYVIADRITSLPKTMKGFNATLVVVDRLTKMTHFMPCKSDSTAHDIARLRGQHLEASWMPLRSTTSRAPEFTNKLIAVLCDFSRHHALQVHCLSPVKWSN